MSKEGEEDVEDIGLEPGSSPVVSSEGEVGETTFAAGGHEVTVQNAMIPWIGQILAGVVLLIAICTLKGNEKNYAYGVSAAVIAIVFALGGLWLMSSGMGDSPIGTYPVVGYLTHLGAISQFNFIWWFIAAFIMTFSGPFLVTSNGYFACWGGVGFAAMGTGLTPEKIKQGASGLGYMNGLLVVSIILLSAVPSEIGQGKQYHGESVFALVVSIVSLVAVLSFTAYPAMLESFKLLFFGIFAIIWVVMACLVTFRGPFVETSNGYFASWIGAILCCMSASSINRGLSENI